jgi:serine/threonine-protein kinase HipA
MAQLMGLPSDSKYEASLEKIGSTIFRFSKRPYLDLIDFLERVIFCFLIGNGDMHLKNWSLIAGRDGDYHLAPCYDFICSRLYLPGEDESALTVNGKRNKISYSDFISLAEYLKIDRKAYENIYSRLMGLKETFLEVISNDIYFEMAGEIKRIITSRYKSIQF